LGKQIEIEFEATIARNSRRKAKSIQEFRLLQYRIETGKAKAKDYRKAA
jgi:hypothetical protein